MTTQKPIIQVVMDPEMLDQVERFWHQHRFRSRGETMRWLMQWALDHDAKPDKR